MLGVRMLAGRRPRAVAASALTALAIAAPSASAAGDTTPPTAPTGVTAEYDNCYGFFVRWHSPTDNVDSPADLRYRFYDRDGRLLWGWDGTTDFAADPSGETTILIGIQRPATARAVDRAGNLSAPTSRRPPAWEHSSNDRHPW
jgi:hypothetical protein